MRFAKGHGTENDFVFLVDPAGDQGLRRAWPPGCDLTGLGVPGPGIGYELVGRVRPHLMTPSRSLGCSRASSSGGRRDKGLRRARPGRAKPAGSPPATRGPCLRRDHGRALAHRRDARSRSPVPPRQRPPSPAETPCRASKTTSRLSVPRARMRTSKRHDDHRGRHRSSTGLGTTSVLMTGHGGRRGAVPGATWCPGS